MEPGLHNIQTWTRSALALRYSDDIVARFWAKVNKEGPVPVLQPDLGPCWLWTASCTGRGAMHGQFTYRADGTQHHIYAHRFAWELEHGPIPDGLKCCHKCDRGACVSQTHMFLGSQYDNLTDARIKGRLRHPRKWAKLSLEDVLAIRATYRPRHNGRALAAQYDISLVHLLRLVREKAPVDQYAFQAPATPAKQLPGPLYSADGPFELVPSIDLPVVGEVR